MHFHRISDGIVSHRLAMSWREDGPAAFAIWHIDLPTASSDLFGPTGRIDFGTKLDSNAEPGQPGGFKLLIEEQRPATLKEAKFVTTHYHKYLAENSLIKSPLEPEILPPGT